MNCWCNSPIDGVFSQPLHFIPAKFERARIGTQLALIKTSIRKKINRKLVGSLIEIMLQEEKMSTMPSDESPSAPFWLVFGVFIFLITLLFLAVFFDGTVGLFDFSNGLFRLQRFLFGSFMDSI